MAASPLASIGKLTELRQRILFVLGAMVVFRMGTHIPISWRRSNGSGGIICANPRINRRRV